MVENKEIPIWHKLNLSIEEASLYSGIGIKKLKELSNDSMCTFTIRIGRGKILIKRKGDYHYEKICMYSMRICLRRRGCTS